MNWQDLICASCAGRVVEGRCPTCRAARRDLSQGPRLPTQAVLLVAALLTLVVLVLSRFD